MLCSDSKLPESVSLTGSVTVGVFIFFHYKFHLKNIFGINKKLRIFTFSTASYYAFY